MKNKSLAFKFIVLVLGCASIIFLGAFLYNFHFSKEAVIKNVEENAKNLTLSIIYKIETVLRSVEKTPLNLALYMEGVSPNRRDLIRLVQCAVTSNPEVFGSAIAFQPYSFDADEYYFAPYFFREEEGRMRLSFLGGDSYRYFTMDWYQIPKELGRSMWTEPYFDEGGGGVIMSTFSAPFSRVVDGHKTFRGVITADISLEWLKQIVASVKIYETGFAFLISQNGVFVTFPQEEFIMRRSIFSVAEEREDEQLRRIGRDMIRGGSGFVLLNGLVSGKPSWMYYAPLPANGWSVGVIFPEAELFADVHRLSRDVIVIGFFGLLLLFITIAFISGTITRPLRFLAKTTDEIAQGNLDVDLPEVAPDDEIGRLTRSFRDMKFALKEYINNLAETTAAKERIESELKIARTIQMSFLPKKFPPFQERESFDIFASLEPAREISGDLYDFFLLDGDRLFFAVGDVSGKGIPAALFMAVTKTLLKGVAELLTDPAHILAKVNEELCHENESMMFVTVFCGILNFKTGELTYSNAGHEPPLILRHDKDPQCLDIPKGLVLGVYDESPYQTRKIVLDPGDTILMYTDGVTEAMNAENVLYSRTRLVEEVRSLGPGTSGSAEGLVNGVMRSVAAFSGGVPQSDDITLVAVRFRDRVRR